MMVVTTVSIFLLGIAPTIAEDKNPIAELLPYFSHKNKKNNKNKESVVLYSIPVRYYGNTLDPSETASIVYGKLTKRLNHVHKTSGLNLQQLEHLLAQRISNSDVNLLKNNIANADIRNYPGWGEGRRHSGKGKRSGIVHDIYLLLSQLSMLTPPKVGIQIIVNVMQCIYKGIKLAMPKDKQAGADELIPTTIYVLACGKCQFIL